MIEVVNVTKRYGAVVALKNVSVFFKKGQIHGLVGKNGAGKSTLVDILYGRVVPTSGKIYINNTEIDFRRYQPNIAQKMKVALVPQQPLVAENLTIEENLFLGSEMMDKSKNLDKKNMRKKTIEILERMGLERYNPSDKISELSIADIQLLNIGQVLYLKDAEIILLDEIAAGLSEERMHFISEKLKEEREKGRTIIYISHRLKEVIGLCNCITVLRDGNLIITDDIKKINFNNLTKYIIGKDIKNFSASDVDYFTNYKEEPSLLEVKNLSIDHLLSNINLKIYKGEVLGVMGLVGSGDKTFMEVIGGVRCITQGDIIYKGRKVFLNNPNKAIKNGIVYLSDNRERDSIFSTFSIKDNLLMGVWEKISNILGIIPKKELEVFYRLSKQLMLKYDKFTDNVSMLSGGNRQKVCVGRLISMDPDIYILNEATKGIDVGVKYELLELIREKLVKSSAVIVSTSEIEELLLVADRIVVFYKGKIHKIISRSNFSVRNVFKAVQGG
jgi:ABC-type sugar transport system ATPase subunit